MIDEAIQELEQGIAKAHEALKRELAKVRTGRASPEMLESIRVDYYGTPTPINQMASVSVPEPRMLMIKPWDKSTLQLVEKAIMTSPLDLNPQNDGELIRIPTPPLTEERRKELTKVARDYGEQCKVSIRAARHDARDVLETLKKEGEVGEDEVERAMKKVEAVVQAGTAKTDEIVEKKEKDIMEI
ncbi:MAG TPA: ribosome recycling factor [Sandaracinaceae bacterium LLY-WYZ-13_1]|nr:ribosome recycling factor [Sandaracinaceae bacterium LLY-WYZ-13_1]